MTITCTQEQQDALKEIQTIRDKKQRLTEEEGERLEELEDAVFEFENNLMEECHEE